MKKKIQPWLLLYILGLLVAFAAGARQGGRVGRENTNKLERLVQDLKSTPVAVPTFPPTLFNVTGVIPCGVRFLLPESVSTESAGILVHCEDNNLPEAEILQKDGYVRTPVPKSNPLMYVWIKSPPELKDSIEMSIQLDEN